MSYFDNVYNVKYFFLLACRPGRCSVLLMSTIFESMLSSGAPGLTYFFIRITIVLKNISLLTKFNFDKWGI
jgi:hypothetical protein